MRYAKLLFLVIGVALLVWVVRQANIGEIWRQVHSISVAEIAGVFVIYALYFGADAVSWQVTLDSVTMNLRWAGRLFVVRMIGEAYNNITPMASLGGEPIKAWLLKTNYNVPLSDSGASLVLAKTASMFSLVVFVAIALVLILGHDDLSANDKTMASAGLAWLVFNVVVFFLMQHLKLSTFTATRLGRTRLGERMTHFIAGLQSVDEQFARFYKHHRGRLVLSMSYAMANWLLGVVELYYILALIGHPVGWWDAWIIEAMVQMIRTAAFFIPAGIGAQEGALMLACNALAGSPNIGVAAALVRRFRELVWIGISLAIAAAMHVNPKIAREPVATQDA